MKQLNFYTNSDHMSEPIESIEPIDPIRERPVEDPVPGMERVDTGGLSLLSLGSARPLAKYVRTVAIAITMVVLGVIAGVTYVNRLVDDA